MRHLAHQVHQLLLTRSETIALAESCTGGEICSQLISLVGASSTVRGGIVAYHKEIKENLLNVDPLILQQYGEVSKECAVAMAIGVARVMESDWGLATTGFCGPSGGTFSAPVGTVCMAIVHNNTQHGSSKFLELWSEKKHFAYESRLQVRDAAVQYLLWKLEDKLQNGF